jgi:small subunit ribosomal protein S21
VRQTTVEIKLKKGESAEKALRRLKRKLDKEDILKDYRDRRYYKKPSERRKEEMNRKNRKKK